MSALRLEIGSPTAIMVGDYVRMLDLILGLALAALLVRAVIVHRAVPDPGWAWRMGALTLADTSIMFTEVGRLGTVVTWRLLVNTCCLIAGIYGVAQIDRHRHPTVDHYEQRADDLGRDR